MKMPGVIIAGAAAFTLMTILSSCGSVEDTIDELTGEKIGWKGTWTINSATLDGQPFSALGGIWVLNDNDWSLSTIVCQANGSLSSNGNNLTLTVTSTNCPETTIPPVGRTASGLADVSGESMTFTLSHDIAGATHTLVTFCKRK